MRKQTGGHPMVADGRPMGVGRHSGLRATTLEWVQRDHGDDGFPVETVRLPMLVLGDAHASEPARREILLEIYRTLDPDAVLQLGDLELYDLPAPTWFIAGNNEDLDVIEALRAGAEPSMTTNVHLLASTAATVDGLRVAGLSGNHAPTQYDRTRAELEGERRRHFTREDIERAAALSDVDLLLTHEAPTGLLSYGYDPGCEHVDDLLESLSPSLCLVGHHHRHREAEIAGTRVVSLAPAWERYYTLDPETLTLEAHDHEFGPEEIPDR